MKISTKTVLVVEKENGTDDYDDLLEFNSGDTADIETKNGQYGIYDIIDICSDHLVVNDIESGDAIGFIKFDDIVDIQFN